MKKSLGLLSALIVISCLTSSSVASAEGLGVAIVDVPQVVAASSEVQKLKKEQQTKAEEIVKFIEKARKDVASITDADKKKAAEEKYTKELQDKKTKMDADYANKLKAIDASISKKIEEQAILKGYDVVLSKGIVLYGGQDITNEVIKAVK